MGEVCEFAEFWFGGESSYVEVGTVDFEDESGVGGDGFLVVGEVGFIGCSYFYEFGA